MKFVYKSLSQIFFNIFILLFFLYFFVANENEIENKILRFRLENGLTVFILEDSSDALVRAELIVRCGYTDQTDETVGYVPLLSKLIFDTNGKFQNIEIQGTKTNTECSETASRYEIIFPPQKTESVLSYLGERIFTPSFTDSAIRKAKEELSEELKNIENNSINFINNVIDTTLNGTKTFQHFSGIQANVFEKKSIAQIRDILYKISEKYYVPSNTALLISGAIDISNIEKLTQQIFNQYGKYTSPVRLQNENKIKTNNKFVLLSETFSTQINQIILHYPNSENNLPIFVTKEILTRQNNKNISKIAKNSKIQIIDENYIDANISNYGKKASLLIQAITNTTTSPVEQSDLLKNEIQENIFSNIKSDSFSNIFNICQNKINTTSSITEFMYKIGNNFANNIDKSNQYKTDFSMEIVQKSIEELIKEPLCFILLHPQTYNQYQSDFEKNGFEVIKDSKKSNLQTNVINTEVKIEKKENFSKEKENLESKKFFEKQIDQFSQHKLTNGIPVLYKKTLYRNESVFQIKIKGGELFTQEIRGLETLMIRSLAENLNNFAYEFQLLGVINQIPKITTKTTEQESYITIICNNKDLEGCIQMAALVILFSDISPATADEIVYNLNYENKIQNQDLGFQMYCYAMKHIFAEKPISSIYNLDEKILQNLNFTMIKEHYTYLLNANRYEFLIISDLNSDIIFNSTEKFFGSFSSFPEKSKLNKNYTFDISTGNINFNETIIYVPLKRTFTTNIPAELAGNRPAKLIPTTNFDDPVLYFSTAPQDKNEIPIFNSVLLELKYRLEEKLNKNVITYFATEKKSVGGIQIEKINQNFDIDSIVFEIAQQIFQELSDDVLIETMKNRWISSVLWKTSTNLQTANLIAESIKNTDNPWQYLNDYENIEKASSVDFQFVMNKYMMQEPILKVYSENRRK